MVWVSALAGVLLSAVYTTATLRIWQRRSKWWSLLALANAVLYTYPTATYIWHAAQGHVTEPAQPLGLLLFILPAALVLRLVQWGIQDEADAESVVEHLGEE